MKDLRGTLFLLKWKGIPAKAVKPKLFMIRHKAMCTFLTELHKRSGLTWMIWT